jgi:phosphatidylglycerol:prolipoprotein diacylglycerol transferase
LGKRTRPRRVAAALGRPRTILAVNPVLGVVAGYPLYVFAATLNAGVAAGLALAVWLARRRGVDPPALLDGAVWALPAGLAGGRLLYAAAHWGEFSPSPLTVFSIWEGGLSLLGAVTAGGLVAGLALRRQGLPVGSCLDAAVAGLALGQAIGRLGCLVAGCATGAAVPPGAPWPALSLPDSTGLVGPRFPSPAVESAGDLLLCLVLLWLWSRALRPGAVAAAYLVGYGLLRGLAEPWRGDSTPLGPLPLAVWWSLLAILAGLLLLWRVNGRPARAAPGVSDAERAESKRAAPLPSGAEGS